MGTEVNAVAFLPDSRTAVIGRYDGRVELWNVQSRQRLANYEGHYRDRGSKNAIVSSIGVSPTDRSWPPPVPTAT